MGPTEDFERRIIESDYTQYEDKATNEAVGEQILEFTRMILAQSKDVQSLFLLGGYGRGEGSVLRSHEKITPLGDYDFLLISRYPHRTFRVVGIEDLRRKFSVQYHVGVDNVWLPLLRFLGKRIYWYEAKFGSKFLFGDDKVLDSIPIHAGNELDIREGFSLLFNRLVGLEMVFDPSLVKSIPSEEQKRHLVFQSIKAILACGESLLLLYGKYHFSYKRRCEEFEEASEHEFPEILQASPNLKSDYVLATRFKLRPSFDMYNDPVKLWFVARNHTLQTLGFYLGKALCMWHNSSEPASSILTVDSFPRVYLKNGKPEILDFLTFSWNLHRRLKSFSNLLKIRKSFSDIVRVSLYHLAISIEEDGDIKTECLENALSTLSLIIPTEKKNKTKKDLISEWRSVRDKVVATWRLCRP